MKSRIIIFIAFILNGFAIQSQCSFTAMANLLADQTHGSAFRDVLINNNPNATRLWANGLFIKHPQLAVDAAKIPSYLQSAVTLRTTNKFIDLLPNNATVQQLDDFVAGIQSWGSGATGKTYKEVVDKLQDVVDNHLPTNCGSFDHFVGVNGLSKTDGYTPRHNYRVLEDIANVNGSQSNLIKNATDLNFNTQLPNAGQTGLNSYPDMYFTSGGNTYIYEMKAGAAFSVEGGNFATQAGAYILNQPINRIRWSLETMPTKSATANALFNQNILNDVAIRQRFADFYNTNLSNPNFATATALRDYLIATGTANDLWFTTMFKTHANLTF